MCVVGRLLSTTLTRSVWRQLSSSSSMWTAVLDDCKRVYVVFWWWMVWSVWLVRKAWSDWAGRGGRGTRSQPGLPRRVTQYTSQPHYHSISLHCYRDLNLKPAGKYSQQFKNCFCFNSLLMLFDNFVITNRINKFISICKRKTWTWTCDKKLYRNIVEVRLESVPCLCTTSQVYWTAGTNTGSELTNKIVNSAEPEHFTKLWLNQLTSS